MAQVPVSIRPTTVDIFGEQGEYLGILSDEHASSSYGLPVLMTMDGITLGPKDLASDLEIVVHYNYRSVASDLYETDEAIKARRDPLQVSLVTAAKTVGYPIANG